VITNLVTYGNINEAAKCITEAASPLVVYDDAVEDGCSTQYQEVFFSNNICSAKKIALLNLETLMKALKPHLILVKKVGPLSFYRRATKEDAISKKSDHLIKK
jgi:hypothetical protein